MGSMRGLYRVEYGIDKIGGRERMKNKGKNVNENVGPEVLGDM
ncbi:uncharacterized protein G2W53_019559 [Senna tora]|uniref:Uncharacterized protein n=1 Tax=Senna tora TaxID=362788 RepID=A0A834WM32_9FABA|nr:uncharacterized protein G2W53_019559 [Senna tora]